MKRNLKYVYVICSLVQNETIIFGSKERAENWIKKYNKDIFDKSEQIDLYISKRVLF